MGRGAPAVKCSFCGKAQSEVARVIGGPGGVCICNDCVDPCTEIFGAENGDDPDVGRSEVRSLFLQTTHLLSGASPDVAADLRAADARF